MNTTSDGWRLLDNFMNTTSDGLCLLVVDEYNLQRWHMRDGLMNTTSTDFGVSLMV